MSMSIATDRTEPRQQEPREPRVRSKLDWAIIASVAAMAAFNLLVVADQHGAPRACAAAPASGVPQQ